MSEDKKRLEAGGWRLEDDEARPRRDRRGILLLVVLSLLVLFSMVTVTFMLVAGQYKRMSRIAGKVEMVGNDPRKQLDEAFGQLARGTLNPHSSLRSHDLLGDLYGNDGVKIVNNGLIQAAYPLVGGAPTRQLIDLQILVDPNNPDAVMQPMPGMPAFSVNLPRFEQMQTAGHFNGCVLTFLNGELKNQSARIVGWGYYYDAGSNQFQFVARIVATEGMTDTSAGTASRLVINGRPFNGTGFGLNPAPVATSPTFLDAMDATLNVPHALLPNPRFFAGGGGYDIVGGYGGADEDYDAADAQNMALAYVPLVDPSNPTLPPASILPSFHRPDLVNYLSTDATYSAIWSDPNSGPQLQRRAMLRPSSTDHPNFNGSNPLFDPINGPWDVDNDGDGVAESVWIDIGLPVQAAPDGRRYKPLVAIHCIDLDGRLNVNAHGNWAQTEPSYNTSPAPIGQPLSTAPGRINEYLFNTVGTAVPEVSLPRGMGVGPAEINLSGLFGNDIARYRQFLEGMTGPNSVVYEGRYGEWLSGATYYWPGRARAPFGPDDILAQLRRYDLPLNYNYYGAVQTHYGSPIDLWGRSMVGVDFAGQPMWSFARDAATDTLATADDETPFDPYTLNLSRKRIRSAATTTPTIDDNTFSPAELERILRRYDLDASALPDRLAYLFSQLGEATIDFPRAITTDSFDLPTPAAGATRDMVADGIHSYLTLDRPSNLTMVDLLKYRMVKNGVPLTDITPQLIAQLLPPEVIAGQKFDLNRPFGNGRDDNSNGVVDEPGENEAAFWDPGNPTLSSLGGGFTTIVPDYSNGLGTSQMARHLYARYLYVMMMLLRGPADIDFDGDTGNDSATETAYGIAQWAINVVDYRDSDSIMTPFEFDINPFNGWTVDGDPSTTTGEAERGLVWGCERPELLITETLALHDIRTEDLPDDDSGTPDHTTTNPIPADRDANFDQRFVPQRSLFIELFNPWTSAANGQTKPSELYRSNAGVLTDGVVLDKLTPPVAGFSQYPVWRLVVTQVPTDPDDPLATPPLNNVERSVYFTDAAPTIANDQRQYYTSLGVRPLPPGGYAVIGPSEPGQTTLHTIPIGRHSTDNENATYTAQTRVVELDLNGDPSVLPTPMQNGATVKNNSAAGSVEPPSGWANARASMAIVMDMSAPTPGDPLNVSDPILGYPIPNGVFGVEAVYSPALDIPLDSDPALTTPGTTASFKTLHLQRLADPFQPWNPPFGELGHDPAKPAINPYLTIDTMPIDIAAFNGVESTGTGNGIFASHQRGDTTIPAGANSLWRREDPGSFAGQASGSGDTSQVFQLELQHTLGYMTTKAATSWAPWAPPGADQIGYTGMPDPSNNQPFAWLTWNSRPFVSEQELLLVPRNRSSRLTLEFQSVPLANPFDPTVPAAGHTPNFFATDANGSVAPQFYRLLDYVHVPSPFVGTDTVFSPTPFNGIMTSQFGMLDEQQMASHFRPPFSHASNYREPGRVNINTIAGRHDSGGPLDNNLIWNAVLNDWRGAPTNTTSWPEIVASRRGNAGNVSDQWANSSSVFANPFRSAAGAAYRLPGTVTTVQPEANVTMLRPNPQDSNRPLFASQTDPTKPYVDPDQHPYFRYQNLMRLNNSLTTRSNVYAVWITMGYFEVSPADPPINYAIYPDGWQLGAELGSDSGDIKRHRAFYIFDRSIPVGYEPGRDHNIDDATLVKRYIE